MGAGAATRRSRVHTGATQPETAMKVLFDTRSSNPDFNGDCDYAVVDMTPALVQQIHRRVELARKFGRHDDDLYELYFLGGAVEFYDDGLIEACQEAIAAAAPGADAERAVQDWLADLEQNGHSILPEGVDLTVHAAQRTECDQFILRCRPYSQTPEFEVAWTTIPKHSDVYVTTRDLPLKALEDYLQTAAISAAKPARAP